MVSLSGQIHAFVMTIVAGASVGILFDLYRSLRSGCGARRLTFLTDLAFWAVATPVVFGVLLAGNWGELRYYVLLGVALGLFVYLQLASGFVLWAFNSLLRGLAQGGAAALRAVGWIVLSPIVLLRGVRIRRIGSRPRRALGGRWSAAQRWVRIPRLRWAKVGVGRFFRS